MLHLNLGKEIYYKFTNNTQVRLWIDVPNSFPWRHCLQKHFKELHTVTCYTKKLANEAETSPQIFTIETFIEDETKFNVYVENSCLYHKPSQQVEKTKKILNSPPSMDICGFDNKVFGDGTSNMVGYIKQHIIVNHLPCWCKCMLLDQYLGFADKTKM